MTDPAGLADRRPFAPVIRSQIDLESAWRDLMQPLGFGHVSLWLMLIGPDDVPLPRLVEITDCAGEPVRDELDNLTTFLAQQQDELCGGRPGARWAVLRSRPGRTPLDDQDRRWAAMLRAACATSGIAMEPLHVATDLDVRPVPRDDLRPAS